MVPLFIYCYINKTNLHFQRQTFGY